MLATIFHTVTSITTFSVSKKPKKAEKKPSQAEATLPTNYLPVEKHNPYIFLYSFEITRLQECSFTIQISLSSIEP
jgi:hypothetical protein